MTNQIDSTEVKEPLITSHQKYYKNNRERLNKKRLENYHKNKDKYKSCNNPKLKQYRSDYYHKKKVNGYYRDYYRKYYAEHFKDENGELIQKKKDYYKKYYDKNKNKYLQRGKKYYNSNEDEILKRRKVKYRNMHQTGK